MSSREIKFRAWDGERMHKISGQGLHLVLWNDPTRIAWGVYDASEARVADSQYGGVLMQYTGLKDKDGREIYEGDIVVADRYPFFNEGVPGYVGVIEWAHGAWYYGLECVNKKLRGNAIGDQLGADGKKVTEFRIIGNIYENPELLTQ